MTQKPRKKKRKKAVPRADDAMTLRNRLQTTQRIVDAFEEVIAERGIRSIGVNRVAEKAGVSKVLIYRYFGGLSGLMAHYIKTGRLLPLLSLSGLSQQAAYNADSTTAWCQKIIQIYRYYRRFQPAYQLMKATVTEKNPLSDEISKAYDEELTQCIDEVSSVRDVDFRAVSAIMLGAMSYLTILSRNDRTLMSIDLGTEEGWQRIEDAIKVIFSALSRPMDSPSGYSCEVQEPEMASEYW